ncbi:MAG: replicative DNA helicase [Actinobacteria bacterium]|nr:MAG: replicative DNA helicase [Actinomycetota bacterium]
METLKTTGQLEKVGGATYLSALVQAVPATSNVKHYAEIVRSKSVLRSIAALGDWFKAYSAQDPGKDIPDIVNEVERKVRDFSDRYVTTDTLRPVQKTILPQWETYYKDRNKRGVLMGLPMGFKGLDGLMGGMMSGDLIILAARPSVGKTAFALRVALNVAQRGRAVGFFSLEMSAQTIADRLVCSEAFIDSVHLRSRTLEETDWDRAIDVAANKISPLPLYIDDDPHLTSVDIELRARRIPNLSLIVIDYLLLLKDPCPKGMLRAQHLGEITSALKAMGRALNVPVLCLTQLNRESDREERPPELYDLRDSGAIEQDADVVVMLHQPKEAKEKKAYKLEAYIRKQRNGPANELISLWFNKRYARFEPVDKVEGGLVS